MKVNFNPHSKAGNISFQKNKGIYVCSPLASGGKEEIEKKGIDIKTHIRNNANNAIYYASIIFNNGDYPYWNHSTWPYFVDDTDPKGRKRALDGCLDLVRRCDALCYFGKPAGGMCKEIEEARKHGIPVITPGQLKDIDKIVEKAEKEKNANQI